MRRLAPFLAITVIGLSSGCSLDSLLGAAGNLPGVGGLAGGKLSVNFSGSTSNADTATFSSGIVIGSSSGTTTTISATSIPGLGKLRNMTIAMVGGKAEQGKTYDLSTSGGTKSTVIYSETDPTKTGSAAAKGWISQSGTLTITSLSSGTAAFSLQNVAMIPGNASKESTGNFVLNGTGSCKLTGS